MEYVCFMFRHYCRKCGSQKDFSATDLLNSSTSIGVNCQGPMRYTRENRALVDVLKHIIGAGFKTSSFLHLATTLYSSELFFFVSLFHLSAPSTLAVYLRGAM